jgi:hypothetical protein
MLMRPAFLLSWDILSSLLALWIGPAIAPILASLSMIVAGFLGWREYGDEPFLYHGIASGGSDLEG